MDVFSASGFATFFDFFTSLFLLAFCDGCQLLRSRHFAQIITSPTSLFDFFRSLAEDSSVSDEEGEETAHGGQLLPAISFST